MNHLSDRELICVDNSLRNMTAEIDELVTLGLGDWASVMELRRHLTLMKKEVAAEGRSPRRQCCYDMTADERRQSVVDIVPQDETGLLAEYAARAREVLPRDEPFEDSYAAKCLSLGIDLGHMSRQHYHAMRQADMLDERRQDGPTHEQMSQVAQLVGQVHGLKFNLEMALRNSSSDEVRQCAKAAFDSLTDAAKYLDDAVKYLVAQKTRNLMDLLGQAHEGK